MGHIAAQGLIRAKPHQVYTFVANPHNAPLYIGAIKRVTSGPQETPKVGDRFAAEAVFMGSPAHIILRLDQLTPWQRVIMAFEGDPAATIQIDLRPANNDSATEIHSRLDVPSVPGFMLEMVMGGMLRESLQRLAAQLGGAVR